jgi:resolvase-like protein
METLTGLPPLSYGCFRCSTDLPVGRGTPPRPVKTRRWSWGSSVNVRFPCRRALWLCPLRYTSTKLSERPQVKRLFDILQSGDTLVVRWIDRLGRDYRDVSDTIRHFMREGVVIKTVINAMVFDGATTDPIQQAVRDALIAFMAAMAQAPQAVATK